MGTASGRDHEEIERGQYRFLQAVRAVCPAPLYDLREQVYPVYSKWAAGRIAPSAQQGDAPEYRTFVLIKKAARAVAAAIDGWCKKYGLIGTIERIPPDHDALLVVPLWRDVALIRSLWPQQWAVETLWAWHSWPQGLEMRNASPPEWVRVSFQFGVAGKPTVTFVVRMDSWIPEIETKTEFRQRAFDNLNRKINDYFARSGTAGQHRRVQAGERKSCQWEWLALRQVAGLTYFQIADKYASLGGEDADTVRKAVETKAKLIGLALRPSRRGPKRRKPEI